MPNSHNIGIQGKMLKSITAKNLKNERDGDVGIRRSKKPKEIAPFGNYKYYYGYRISEDVEEDPRFKVLMKEWFENKDCLDIGCNSGLITINIAKKFHCRSILGIDIDYHRIKDAYLLLQKHRRIDSEGISHGETLKCDERIAKLSRVSFQQEDFVKSSNPLSELYDTIICFSVTKWIHMNHGDEGLITLFVKIWRLLRPGGIFLLEPQPWKSYEKNRRVTKATASNYAKIELYPECFQEILLDKIGFRGVQNVSYGDLGTKTGFDRPVLAFRK